MVQTRTGIFGDLIRRHRLAAGLTQEELAERAGVSARGISDLERGMKLRPHRGTIALLADALGLSGDERARFAAAARARTGSTSAASSELNGAGALVTSPSSHHNLPLRLTNFVGREREIAAVRKQLRDSRVVTLTGTGGCGKTRLGLETAASLVDDFRDGVWLVDLAALSDPVALPAFVASALAVREVPGQPAVRALVEHARSRQMLLILDNCEHLVDACATLVETLVLQCPRLSILATSREALGVPGEVAWPVPPLSIPDPPGLAIDEVAQVNELMGGDAIRLFVDRARLVAPSFEVTPKNASPLARTCRRLDGLPLAIELAAARVKLLSLDQIAERLDNCFALLSAGRRGADTRHRTLWATMEWSYELLAEPERALFRRLSVFAGGFTLEAAEAVGAASLETLGQLVDKSLVVVEQPAGGTPRYRLLETVRQYAAEKLGSAGEVTSVRRQHARYFLHLAEAAEPGLTGAERARWLEVLAIEHDNLRVAIEWSRGEDGEAEVALRLVGALWWFWNLRGHLSEGRAQTEATLAVADTNARSAHRAKALASAGAVAWLQGDYVGARARLQESVDIWREVGEGRGLAIALTILAFATARLGDLSTALTLATESVDRFREVGDPWGLAWTLNNLGYISSARGDFEQARTDLAESLDRFRQLGDTWGVALPLSNLGYLAYRLGEYSQARVYLDESLAIFRALDHYWAIPRTLNSLGNIERCLGEHARASLLYEESLRLCRAHDDLVGIAVSLHNLARVAQARGDLERAAELFAEGLTTFRKEGNRRGLAECLVGLAGVAAMRGQAEEAARLFGAAEASRGSGDLPLSPVNRAEAERDLALARGELDPAIFAAAWKAGASLSIEQAVEQVSRRDRIGGGA